MVIVLFVVAFRLLVIGRGAGNRNVLDASILWVTSPIQRTVSSMIEGLFSALDHYLVILGVKQENEQLRKQIAELRHERGRLAEVVLENERLRALLQLKGEFGNLFVVGRVFAKDADQKFQEIRIDFGDFRGLQVGYPVVAANGGRGHLIGQIIRTHGRYADALLIFDTNSAIPSLVQRNRESAIVLGQQSQLELTNFPRQVELIIGDRVVTSGITGKFPKGLLLGEIVKIDKKKYGAFQRAVVNPLVDIRCLEEVMVLIPDARVGGWRQDEGADH